MKISNAVRAIALCFCLALINQLAHAQAIAPMRRATVRIGGWALTDNNKIVKNFDYKGSCPVKLKFAWGVLATEPTEIKYHFERSDGATAPAGKKNLPKANTSEDVIETWDLGANTAATFKAFKGWEELVIDSPNKVSQKINFTMHCK
jgi:hypothetical protein